MNSIKFNTKVINEKITSLNTEKQYYSNKKSSFASSNFNSVTKLTNYLNKIQSIYSDISTNIGNIADYLNDYSSDAEGLENLMSGLSGSIKDAAVSGIVENYKNKIENYLIDDSNLFDIIEFNKETTIFSVGASSSNINQSSYSSVNISKNNNSNNSGNSATNNAGLFMENLANFTSFYNFDSGTYEISQVDGMHYDFITGAMVPDNNYDETTITSLLVIDEMVNALASKGIPEEEIFELFECETEEDYNKKLLDLEMKYDPEARRQIYENSYLMPLSEQFAKYGDYDITSLADLDSIISELNSLIEASSGNDTSMTEKLIQQRDLYKYLSDYVKEEISYIEECIDPYKYQDDFNNNNIITDDSLQNVEEYLNSLYYDVDSVTGETYASMPIKDPEGTATLLYALFNDTGQIDYHDGLFYKENGVLLSGANLNMFLSDFAKWEQELTIEEKNIYNYVYNSNGPLAAYEWLNNIANKIDERYVSSKSEEAQKFAEENPALATLYSFNPLERLGNSLKILWSSATDQKLRKSYTIDDASIYRSTVSEYIGENYGEGWKTVYDIGTSAVEESAWSIMHVLSGGVTTYYKAALAFMEGFPGYVGDALENGYTDDQAVFKALLCGAAEAVTEYKSASTLLHIEDTSNYILSPYIFIKHGAVAATFYNLFVGQPVTEIFEELTSDGAQRLIDVLLSGMWGYESQMSQNYNDYLELYGNRFDSIVQLVKDYCKDVGNIALQTYFSTLISSSVFEVGSKVKNGGSNNSNTNNLVGDYNAALQLVNKNAGDKNNIKIDNETATRAFDAMIKIKSGELNLTDIFKGINKIDINSDNTSNIDSIEGTASPLMQESANYAPETAQDSNVKTSEVKNADIKPLADRVREAAKSLGYTSIEIPNVEVLNNNIVSNLKSDDALITSRIYFTFTNENGEKVNVFVPSTSTNLEYINKEVNKPLESENPGEVNKYQVDSEHTLYYDLVTGKTYNYTEMAQLMQEHNKQAQDIFYAALDKIKLNTTDPIILEFANNFSNISNLTKTWNILYDALNGSRVLRLNNVVYLDLETFSNPKRLDTFFHEVSHSIQNAANDGKVPSNYLNFLFKAVDYIKKNPIIIQNLSKKSQEIRSKYRQLAAQMFDNEFDSDLRAKVFSEEHRNNVINSLENGVLFTSEDIDNLLQIEYEQSKDNKVHEIYVDNLVENESVLNNINAIICDIFGAALGKPLNYVDENGNVVELSPFLFTGHTDDYNKRIDFISSSFHELMAMFGSGVLADEYNNNSKFSQTFIEIFGQEFYDFINNFYLESLSCISKGEHHKFDTLDYKDVRILGMYIKSFGTMLDLQGIPNASDIDMITLNKNNVELDANGEYNLKALINKVSEFTKYLNIPVVIDVSQMSQEQYNALTNALVREVKENYSIINVDNIRFLYPSGEILKIGSICINRENTNNLDPYRIVDKLKALSSKYQVYIDVTGMESSEINKLIFRMITYSKTDGIDFNNVKLLNNGKTENLNVSINQESIVKNDEFVDEEIHSDIKPLADQVREAAKRPGFTSIEIPNVEVLNNNIVSGIKHSDETYFTFTNENGEKVNVFVPSTSIVLEEINNEIKKPLEAEDPSEVNKYQVDADHTLYYDLVTGKTYNYTEMAQLMQEHNKQAQDIFYDALDKIKLNTTNPIMLEFANNFSNISNLSKTWNIVYDALSGSFVRNIDNIVHLDLETFSNPKRIETFFHEVSHSIQNAANDGKVPSNYLDFLFKAIDYMKKNPIIIQNFGKNSQELRSKYGKMAEFKFDSEFDSDLKAKVFSEENRTNIINSLGKEILLTDEDINNLLKDEYETLKKVKISEIYDDYMRDSEYTYSILNGIIGDILGVAVQNPLNYIDENGNLVELSPSIIYGHTVDYNKKINFISSAFHELMAEFGSGLLLDEYHNTTEFSQTFIEVFGQDFYDFISNFYLESLSCISKNESHEFDALSDKDLKILGMYLKSFRSVIDLKVVPNVSNISEVLLNKNNVELDANGEYDINKLFQKLSTLTVDNNTPVVIDIRHMTEEQLATFSNQLVTHIASFLYTINIDNIKLLINDGQIGYIDYIVLNKENTNLTSKYMLKNKLKKISSNHQVYIDVTGMESSEINNLIFGIITSIGAEDINFNNVKLLNNGRYYEIAYTFDSSNIMENGKIKYDLYSNLKNATEKIKVNLDLTGFNFEQLQNFRNYINRDGINFDNISLKIKINDVDYSVNYNSFVQYVDSNGNVSFMDDTKTTEDEENTLNINLKSIIGTLNDLQVD